MSNQMSHKISDRLKKIQTGAFWELIGAKVIHADNGHAIVEMHIEDKHLQAYGILHGGVLATLIDNGIGAAVHSLLTDEQASATVDLNVKFLKGISEGVLQSEAKVFKKGRNMMFAECSISNEKDELIAWGSGTFAVLDRKRWKSSK